MIIDCHTHIAGAGHLPAPFMDGWTRTIKAGLPGSLSPAAEARLDGLFRQLTTDPDCAALLREMDDAGIDKAVVLVIDFGLAFPGGERSLAELHDDVRALMRTGRFIGFVGVDPRRGRDGVEFFERAVRDWGFRGLKLYPPCGYSPSDERLFPYYEICAAHGLPVLTHVGPTSCALSFKHTRPDDVDDAAHRFPKVNFILAHAAVTWHEEAGRLAQYRPNVFLDVSGFQSELADGSFLAIMRAHRRRGLCRKLLFGTDWPIHRFFGSQQKWVDAMRELERQGALSADELAGILGGNALRLIPGLAAPPAADARPPRSERGHTPSPAKDS